VFQRHFINKYPYSPIRVKAPGDAAEALRVQQPPAADATSPPKNIRLESRAGEDAGVRHVSGQQAVSSPIRYRSQSPTNASGEGADGGGGGTERFGRGGATCEDLEERLRQNVGNAIRRRPASAPPGSRRAVHDTDLSAESDAGEDREASVKHRRRLIRRDKYALIGDIVRALVASNILEYPSKIAHDKDKIRQRGESKILYDAIEKSLKSNESELIDELDRGTEPESRVSANRLPVHPTPSPPASFQSRSATTLSPRHVSHRRVVSQSHLLKTGSQRKNENATSAVSVKCWDSEKGYTLQHSDPSSTGKFGSAGGFKESEEADGSDRVRGVAYDGGRSPGSGNDRSMNGRSRKGKINMYSTLLMQKYAISARHVTTAHQAYGLFSKTLETQRRKRAKMRKTGVNET